MTFQNSLMDVLEGMMDIDGALAAAIIEVQSGTCIAQRETAKQSYLGQAATMNPETVRTLTNLGRMMADTGNLEDMVVTFHGQYHIVRPLQGEFMEGLFLLLVLERSLSSDDLSFARYKLMHIVFGLSLVSSESMDTLHSSPNRFALPRRRNSTAVCLPEQVSAYPLVALQTPQ